MSDKCHLPSPVRILVDARFVKGADFRTGNLKLIIFRAENRNDAASFFLLHRNFFRTIFLIGFATIPISHQVWSTTFPALEKRATVHTVRLSAIVAVDGFVGHVPFNSLLFNICCLAKSLLEKKMDPSGLISWHYQHTHAHA